MLEHEAVRGSTVSLSRMNHSLCDTHPTFLQDQADLSFTDIFQGASWLYLAFKSGLGEDSHYTPNLFAFMTEFTLLVCNSCKQEEISFRTEILGSMVIS